MPEKLPNFSDIPGMKWVDEDIILNPLSGQTVVVFKNFYWIENGKKQVAFYDDQPQCNHDIFIIQKFFFNSDGTPKFNDVVSYRSIPLAFVPKRN